MTPIVNAIANSILVAGSIFLTFGLLEVGLRIDDAMEDPRPAGHHELCCEYHPLLGWRHRPDITIERSSPEYQITEHYNSRGVRGPEYSLEKPSDEYRILVLGDSFAEGITVDFNELFSEVMKRRLNDGSQKEFQVINLGVAGYSTDQQLLLLREEGRLYHPDVTVLMVYDNDIWFNAQRFYTMMGRGHKPMFELIDGELQLVTDPVPRETVTEVPEVQTEISGLGLVKHHLNEHSYAYRWVRTRVRNTASIQSMLVSLGLMDRDSARPFPPAYGIYARTYSPETQQAWIMTEALIAEIRKEVESTDSRFVLFHAPFAATIHDEDWIRFKQNYGVTDAMWSPDQVNDELASIAAGSDMDFLNVVEDLRSAAAQERLHFEQDTHWNVYGNRVVGELMASHIRMLASETSPDRHGPGEAASAPHAGIQQQ